ncbi:helix-turn-helix domain-containing protein [Mesorhizobium sp. M0833]|uniref:helix-turn-helix domain-containing protein n=1 Tax=Mesorhizobium sp. M0833 TaxID=2957009 RepID=UPI00333D6801
MNSSKQNRRRGQWPSADLLTRATFVNDAGPIRFVDTDAAAKYLALDPHTLECYRSRDTGPAFYKFGRYVRYAVADLDAWVEHCRRSTSASPVAPRILPIDPT